MRDFFKFLKKTPFKADLYNVLSEEGGNIPPPFVDFRITQVGDERITMNGQTRQVQ